MSSAFCDVKLRRHQRPQSLVRMMIGVGCLTVIPALSVGGGRSGLSLAATAVEWISCADSLILIALLDWGMRLRHPGISSLVRKCSYGAIAGSLMPCAASLIFSTGRDATPALTGALAGLALILFSAMQLGWLLRDIDLDLPPWSESMVMARLTGLMDIAERCAAGGVQRGH